MGDTCVPSLNVINTKINQLQSKVSLKTIKFYCLRLFVVVYKHVILYIASVVMVADKYIHVPCITVISTNIYQLESKVSLITAYCLRLFVYKPVMLHAQGQR